MLTWILTALVTCGPVTAAERGSTSLPAVDCAAENGGAAGADERPAPAPKPDAEPKKTKKTKKDAEGLRASWKQHPSIKVGSAFRLDVKATLQEDAHASGTGTGDLDPFELRKNRIGVSGNFFKRVEFEVEREVTEKAADATKPQKSPWGDVYVNVSAIKNAQIQAGKFKVPFGRDELTSSTQNDFAFRSLGARYLAPARDVGAMVHGRFFKRGLNYWAGVFAHDGEHARSSKVQGGDQTVAARVTGRPFRPFGLDSIELGTAFAVSSLSDDSFEPNGLRGRTVLTQDTFFHPVYVKGQRRRWEGDVDWTAGRAMARAEMTWVNDDRRQQGIGDEDLPAARARSWYVAGGWILKGERKKQRPNVEIVGRYERLWFDSAGGAPADASSSNPRAEFILPSGNQALTVGVNWVLNRWIKLQVNGIRERVEDAERSPAPEGAAFWSRVFRIQFAL